MSIRALEKICRRERRKHAVRKNIFGTTERPRLSIFKSARHIYAQVIDDVRGHTLVAASTMEKDLKTAFKNGGNATAAKQVGEKLAEKALAAGIKSVVFDRNGFRYHGRLRALADAARQKGLQF
jgi:large subunit ribosomal protein L18